MIPFEAVAAADGVGQAQLGAHLLEETTGKAAAENLVHHGEGGNVGIVAVGAEADDLDIGLVHIFLVDEEDSGLGIGEAVVACW
jgi:hypothetical protein